MQRLSRPSARWRPTLRTLRRPLPWWVASGVLAVLAAGGVARVVDAAAADREQWGRLEPVLVATADIAAGEEVAGRLERRLLPTGLVPDGAVREVPDGTRATATVHRGEALHRGRISGTSGLPPGTRGVAVPAPPGLPLRSGDLVDVLATFEPDVAGDEPTFPVAERAVVMALADDAVTVAVPADDAARVVYALTTGVVTVVLTG